jgi:hypothetical protein
VLLCYVIVPLIFFFFFDCFSKEKRWWTGCKGRFQSRMGFGSWKKMGGVITGVNVVWVQVGMRGSGLSGNWCQLGDMCVLRRFQRECEFCSVSKRKWCLCFVEARMFWGERLYVGKVGQTVGRAVCNETRCLWWHRLGTDCSKQNHAT